jgi:hypothetical protein
MAPIKIVKILDYLTLVGKDWSILIPFFTSPFSRKIWAAINLFSRSLKKMNLGFYGS